MRGSEQQRQAINAAMKPSRYERRSFFLPNVMSDFGALSQDEWSVFTIQRASFHQFVFTYYMCQAHSIASSNGVSRSFVYVLAAYSPAVFRWLGLTGSTICEPISLSLHLKNYGLSLKRLMFIIELDVSMEVDRHNRLATMSLVQARLWTVLYSHTVSSCKKEDRG